MQSVLARIATEQDYLWFVALLFWASAAAVWSRSARAKPPWRWLPWAAAGAAAISMIEIVAFAIPVQPRPGVPAHWATERLLIAAAVLGLAGMMWRVDSVRRCLRVVFSCVLLMVAAFSWIAPGLAHALLAVLTAVICGLHWRAATRWGRAALVGVTLAAVFSSWGPVAEWATVARRWTSVSWLSVVWSGTHAAAGLVVLQAVWSDTMRHRPRFLTDSRGIIVAAAAWLVLGLVLAAVAGAQARSSFEMSALARARIAAAFINRDALVRLLEPDFTIAAVADFRQPTGKVSRTAIVPRLAGAEGAAVRQQLTEIARANVDANNAYLLVARGGHVLAVPSMKNRSRPDRVMIVDHAWRQWATRAGYYEPPTATAFGMLTHARAPVLTSNGAVLGWLSLDFPPGSWVASQAQARLLVFVIVVFGLGVAALFAGHRVRTQEREHARAAAQAAAEANQLKTVFLAKVSHELRTPIQSILGYAELLRDAVADPVARSRLEAQRQHGELMLRLVNDLLDLSAMQTGAFRLHPKPTPLVALVEQTSESLAPRARAKGIQFSFRAHQDVPEWVSIDGERLRQVVLNLVSNAIKFTEHGSVTVTLEPGATPDALELAVRDTGPGIPSAAQKALFQPFSRLETTAATEGTGLGLALAAALCRSMGGDILIDSAPGEGACFRACFRALRCAPPELAHTSIRNDCRVDGLSVVVADDNALVRQLFVAFLEQEGAVCHAAVDGEEAIAIAVRQPPHAIVLDLAMPGLGGIEVARSLRERFGPGIRIVAVSAHAGKRDGELALQAGADVFLTKPVELAELARAVAGTAKGEFARGVRPNSNLLFGLETQFRHEVSAQCQAVTTAIAERDSAALQSRAHYLKNSAAVVGDDALFEACAALEALAEARDFRGWDAAWLECQRVLAPWIRPTHAPFTGGGSPVMNNEKKSDPSCQRVPR